MYIPPNFYIQDVNIIDSQLINYIKSGVYTIWAAVFRSDSLLSNVTSASFKYENNSNHSSGIEDIYDGRFNFSGMFIIGSNATTLLFVFLSGFLYQDFHRKK